MDNPRPEKVAVVAEVRARLSSSSAVLLTEYRGLKVSDIATLRRSLRAVGGDYKIYKNTLVRFAVRDLGLEGVEDLLVGPTALAFVDGDAAAVAKALRDFSRINPNLVLKGGVLGSKALNAEEARALADLPSREVLLARIAGGLAAPMVQFAGLLQALPRNLAYGLKALIDLKVAGGEAAAPEPSAAPEAAAETLAAATEEIEPAAATETETEAAPAAEADEATTEDVPAPEAPETASEIDDTPTEDVTDAAPAAEAETAEEA